MLIYIVGFMGSGKSSLLRKWQSELSVPSFDFDEELERRFQVGSGELGDWIRKNSWGEFRRKEAELLKETLADGSGVYALGGGTFSEENQKLIKETDAKTLWVNTPVDTCWARVEGDFNRPLVQKGQEEFFALHNSRVPLYSQANYSFSGEIEFPTFKQFCKKHSIY